SPGLPCSFAAAPPSGRLFSVLYASLVLCGLAVMVAAVLTVEVLARRRRSARLELCGPELLQCLCHHTPQVQCPLLHWRRNCIQVFFYFYVCFIIIV
ncbi:hypothetical protein ANANG_G00217930, partial [Anguilla anguilla]